MTESEKLTDPRAMDDEEFANEPDPPSPAEPSDGPEVVAEDEYAEGETSDPKGAHRDAPAGEDYAGSGF